MKRKIHIRCIPPGKKSIQLLKSVKQVIGRTNYVGLYGVSLKKGDKCYIEDVDGNIYIDCLSAASTNVLGYNYGNITNYYAKVAKQIQHTCFLYSPNRYAIQLAEQLISITPGKFKKKVLLGLSGSDASGGAIKAMRKFTKNMAIIHFKNDYHGATGLSQAASHFGNLNKGIYDDSRKFLEAPYPTTEEASEIVLSHIRSYFKNHQAGGVIAEAIQGDAGVHIPIKGFFKKLRLLTNQYDALLIIDEVQSGMGRTGKWWAIEHEKVIPDIIISAKGLSAGYAPISAVIGREDVLDALLPGEHIFTYGSHAPSAAAALQTIKVIKKKKLVTHAKITGTKLIRGLKRIWKRYPDIIKDVRGRGLMIGVEIDVSIDELAGKVFATRCMEKGIYVGFFGVHAEVIRIEPPFCIGHKEVETIVNTISDVANEMDTGTIPDHTYDNVRKYSIGI